ncbi:glutamate ABC transporter substrate-binding protein [Kibdelosporangium persicum]|uniref:Periplasmic component of amino acid ABC-type transporter/signal transduction system n=1 Tax=Kibdelosporangium persicum TaxID=2698649 RepID=A0ABX2FF05_9PSEU|nr:glutamate ABC transporter substrate-binding protein [Kibdelosporangium persicum]NRN69964.1 Periplasmic component of amino acid ABC-type transporter/signal transduction system [Kibdelosporangium persicum]
MRLALVSAAILVMVMGCTTGTDITTIPSVTAVVPKPANAADLTTPPTAAVQECGDKLASLRPPNPMPQPGAMPAGSTMERIVQRGKLIVGVDQNTYNVGFRDPFTGEIQGFDIDMARTIASALFGTPDAIQLRAITSDQRIPALKAGDVDIVVRTMSITCDRLVEVNFSAVYYEAQQQVLVRKNSGFTGIDALGGKRVCATKSSTSLRNIANAPSKPIGVSVSDWTDCLVMLQQGQVDAVSTDDVILAGMAAQDRYTEVVGPSLAAEPYGMAIPKANEDFVRFVNGVLEQVRANGTWAASYGRWLDELIPGPPPAPPVPRYKD